MQVEERNAKLLQTLSEATDMLAEADEMQVPSQLSRFLFFPKYLSTVPELLEGFAVWCYRWNNQNILDS